MTELRVRMTVRADEVIEGDITVDLPVEMDYQIDLTGRAEIVEANPQEIKDAGGWVVLTGDTEDGYYARHYEGMQEYHAAPDQMITVLREVAEFEPLAPIASHDHSTTTGLVGYAIRHTIRNGEVIRGEDGRVGVDVQVVSGPANYGNALTIAGIYRTPSSYAVVDNLYGCGCRGGHR